MRNASALSAIEGLMEVKSRCRAEARKGKSVEGKGVYSSCGSTASKCSYHVRQSGGRQRRLVV